MKKTFLSLFMLAVVSFIFSECMAVTDVGGTKYEEAVTYLIENNIISGYPDNTFKPEKTITRAEISTVITKFNKIQVLDNITSKFIDVDNHWGKTYINTLAELGFVSGYENNDFRPDNEVTYAEVTAMVLNSLGYKEEISKLNLGWPNNYISKADDMELYKNLDASNPNKKMTRGEVAIFVYNVPENLKNNVFEEIFNNEQIIEMPNVVGLKLQEAKDLLEEKNILIGSIIEQSNNSYEKGIVAYQQPISGMRLKKGTENVKIIVSTGRAEIKVPDISNLSLAMAKEKLDASDIMYMVVEEFNDVVPMGYVIRTEPSASQTISANKIIDVYVSAGPEKNDNNMWSVKINGVSSEQATIIGSGKYKKGERVEVLIFAFPNYKFPIDVVCSGINEDCNFETITQHDGTQHFYFDMPNNDVVINATLIDRILETKQWYSYKIKCKNQEEYDKLNTWIKEKYGDSGNFWWYEYNSYEISDCRLYATTSEKEQLVKYFEDNNLKYYNSDFDENNSSISFTWNVTSESLNKSFEVVTGGEYKVDWGDGANTIGVGEYDGGDHYEQEAWRGSDTHTYLMPGTYTVTLTGNIVGLDCSNVAITELDITKAPLLRDFCCEGNNIKELDLSNSFSLCGLDCSNNEISELELENLWNLSYGGLDCSFNKIKTLDLSNNNFLYNDLDCSYNEIEFLDVSGFSGLHRIDCNNNQIKELNVSGCTSITNFDCSNNQISKLDVSDCKGLRNFNCSNNKIDEIDVDSCTKMYNFYCSDNLLKKLDVSHCKELSKLECRNNLLKSIDVSKNEKLTVLSCSQDTLTEILKKEIQNFDGDFSSSTMKFYIVPTIVD